MHQPSPVSSQQPRSAASTLLHRVAGLALAALVLGSALPGAALAQSIYRCTERGRVTYQDAACAPQARQRVLPVAPAQPEAGGVTEDDLSGWQGQFVEAPRRPLVAPAWRALPAAPALPVPATLTPTLRLVVLMLGALLFATTLAVPRFAHRREHVRAARARTGDRTGAGGVASSLRDPSGIPTLSA